MIVTIPDGDTVQASSGEKGIASSPAAVPCRGGSATLASGRIRFST